MGRLGALAQLGERRLCKPEVAGSIPARSTWEPAGNGGFSAWLSRLQPFQATCSVIRSNQLESAWLRASTGPQLAHRTLPLHAVVWSTSPRRAERRHSRPEERAGWTTPDKPRDSLGISSYRPSALRLHGGVRGQGRRNAEEITIAHPRRRSCRRCCCRAPGHWRGRGACRKHGASPEPVRARHRRVAQPGSSHQHVLARISPRRFVRAPRLPSAQRETSSISNMDCRVTG